MQSIKTIKSMTELTNTAISTVAKLQDAGFSVTKDAVLALLIDNELPGCKTPLEYCTRYEIQQIQGDREKPSVIDDINHWLSKNIGDYVASQTTANGNYFNFVMAEIWHKTAFCDYRYDAAEQMKEFLLSTESDRSLKEAAMVVFEHEQKNGMDQEHAWKILLGRACWSFTTIMRDKIRNSRMKFQEFLLCENILAPISASTAFQFTTKEALFEIDWVTALQT